MAGFEMEVSLDFQPPFQSNAFELLQANRTELWTLTTQITKPEQPIVVVGIHFTDEPCRTTDRIKEFDHRRVVLIAVGPIGE